MTELPRTCTQCGNAFQARGIPRDLTGPADSQLLCPECAPAKPSKAVAKRVWQAAGSIVALAIPFAALVYDFVTDEDDPAESPRLEITDTVSAIIPAEIGTPNAEAAPLNDPGSWIEPGDYPLRSLRDDREGAVAFTLRIDDQGYATDCTVTESSGADDLDAATCLYVVQRARFSPARDGAGRGEPGTYSNRIVWKIAE